MSYWVGECRTGWVDVELGGRIRAENKKCFR